MITFPPIFTLFFAAKKSWVNVVEINPSSGVAPPSPPKQLFLVVEHKEVGGGRRERETRTNKGEEEEEEADFCSYGKKKLILTLFFPSS